MEKVLLYFALKYNGDWDSIYNALDKKEKISIEDLEDVENKIDCEYITILNPLYPDSLKNSHKPPFVIFYKGDVNMIINYKKIFTFIWEERLTNYSQKEYEKIIRSLSKENKYFISTKEDEITELYNKQFIILKPYIQEQENKNGIIISEKYFKNDNINNSLIFKLPNSIIVIQIKAKGETINNIHFSVNENKDVFVIPQENSSKKYGNNWLIKQGAKLVEYPSDIIDEI